MPNAVQALAAAGVQAAASAAEAARGADVVITMLPAGEHVRDVWLHQGGLIEAVKGSAPLLIDCSTIDVESARVVTEAARVAGLEMLDAPVSGGVGGATAATLTFMVGGSETAFARGLPVLQAMGKNIVHAGGPGAGQAAKICNNMMLAINMVGVSEGFLLAQKLGLDWDKLFQIASTASGAILGTVQLLSRAGPGSRRAVKSRLRGGLHGGADAEGCEAVAGRGGCHRIPHAARRPRHVVLSGGRRCWRRRQGFFRRVPLAGKPAASWPGLSSFHNANRQCKTGRDCHVPPPPHQTRRQHGVRHRDRRDTGDRRHR